MVRLLTMLLLAISLLAAFAGGASADTVTDCTAVNDKATASAKSGIKVNLSTSGKTCTFSIESSSNGSGSNFDPQTIAQRSSQAFNNLSSAVVRQDANVFSDQDVIDLLLTPILGLELTFEQQNALQNAGVLGGQGFFADCVRRGLADSTTFENRSAAFGASAGCGVIRLSPEDQPVDITLEGTDEGRVQIRGSGIVFVMSLMINDQGFYMIVETQRLFNEAN